MQTGYIEDIVSFATRRAWTYDTLRLSLIHAGPSLGMDVGQLWRHEEMRIDGLRIGMMCDGDPVDGDMLLFSALGTPPDGNTRALNRHLLEGNHHGIGTDGCTLGRHRGTGVVTLYARLPIPVTVPTTLLAKVRNMKHIALIWRGDIQAVPDARSYRH